ncbi:MAG: hypothetical protein P8X65_12140 [Syntrophobacterales bacterium]
MKGLISAILVILLLGASAPAWSHEPRPAPSAQTLTEQEAAPPLPRTMGPIITDVAITQPVKTWTLQIYPTLYFVGGVFSPNWQRRPVGGDQKTRERQILAAGDYRSLLVPVVFYYGLAPRMDVEVTVPFIQHWASNVGPVNQAANFGSLGDSSVALRYMFLNGKSTAPTVTGYFAVLFPTGHANNLEPKLLGIDQTGNGAFAFTWGIEYFNYLPKGPILVYANIWYTNFVDGRVNGVRVYYPDQVAFNLAFEVPLRKSPRNRWALLVELLSTWDAGRMSGHKANQPSTALVTVLPALEFLPTSWFSVALGVQVDLIGKNTPYTYAPTLSLLFSY